MRPISGEKASAFDSRIFCRAPTEPRAAVFEASSFGFVPIRYATGSFTLLLLCFRLLIRPFSTPVAIDPAIRFHGCALYHREARTDFIGLCALEVGFSKYGLLQRSTAALAQQRRLER